MKNRTWSKTEAMLHEAHLLLERIWNTCPMDTVECNKILKAHSLVVQVMEVEHGKVYDGA